MISFKRQKWSTELPTEPGFYLAYSDANESICGVEVETRKSACLLEDDGVLVAWMTGHDVHCDLGEFSLWIGPFTDIPRVGPALAKKLGGAA